jgi:hypothetical protein
LAFEGRIAPLILPQAAASILLSRGRENEGHPHDVEDGDRGGTE